MAVLITGGGGFIGSHLMESQLQKGRTVRVVDLDFSSTIHLKDHPQLEVIRGDISDPTLVREVMVGVEFVYHLASIHLQTGVPESRYRAVNVDAVESLLRAAQTAGVRRFVHCSSIGVYGVITDPPADEETPTNAVNVYERTKLAGERVALAFARETGFPVVVTRPGWVYGPRCPRTLKLFRAVESGHFLMIGAGRVRRQPLYVSDAVAGFELCAETERAAGQVYVMAGTEEITIEELVRRISEVSGTTPRIIRIPRSAAEAVALVVETGSKLMAIQPLVSRRNLEFFTRDNAFSILKARQELGFEPSVRLEEGLRATSEWLTTQKLDGKRNASNNGK